MPVLRVCETVYGGHFDQPKTKRSARTIPLGTETAEILAVLRPAVVDPKALVLATREGLPLERWNLLRKHLEPAAKKLGFPGVTWHLLRHCHATMLDSEGTPIGTMQSLLGHSTPEITREIYLHAIPEEQRRAMQNVERLLFGPKWTQVSPPAQSATTRVKFRSLVVGAPGFEPGTSCAQGNCKKSISLVRLALFCVMVPGFGPNLSALGPKWT